MTSHPASSPSPQKPIASGEPVNASLIPLLHTNRLTLRAHQLTDLESASIMWSDPDVVKHIGGSPRSPSEVWTTIQRGFGCWHLLGYGFWVITDITTGEFLGEIGFLEGLRDIIPPHAGTPEAGWCLAKHAWGKGFASEALASVVAWADTQLSCPETTCIIDLDNLASAKVATSNGYRFTRNAQLNGEHIATYSRRRGGSDQGA